MSSASAWLLVAATVLGLSIGQVLFKRALRINSREHAGPLAWIDGSVVTALLICLVSTFLWIGAHCGRCRFESPIRFRPWIRPRADPRSLHPARTDQHADVHWRWCVHRGRRHRDFSE
jgi:hypothetical protein